MAVPVDCPHCDKSFQLPEHFLGKTARCPGCKKTFVAEQAEASAEAPEELGSDGIGRGGSKEFPQFFAMLIGVPAGLVVLALALIILVEVMAGTAKKKVDLSEARNPSLMDLDWQNCVGDDCDLAMQIKMTGKAPVTLGETEDANKRMVRQWTSSLTTRLPRGSFDFKVVELRRRELAINSMKHRYNIFVDDMEGKYGKVAQNLGDVKKLDRAFPSPAIEPVYHTMTIAGKDGAVTYARVVVRERTKLPSYIFAMAVTTRPDDPEAGKTFLNSFVLPKLPHAEADPNLGYVPTGLDAGSYKEPPIESCVLGPAMRPVLGNCFTQDNQWAILTFEPRLLAVADAKTFALEGWCRLQGDATHVAVDVNRKLAFTVIVPDDAKPGRGKDALHVYSIKNELLGDCSLTLKPLHSEALGGRISHMFANTDATLLHLYDATNRKFMTFDTNKNEITGTSDALPPRTDYVCITPDGKSLFAATHEQNHNPAYDPEPPEPMPKPPPLAGKIHRLEVASLKVDKTLNIKFDPSDIAATDDGLVFVTQGSGAEATVGLLNFKTEKFNPRWGRATLRDRLQISPKGNLLFQATQPNPVADGYFKVLRMFGNPGEEPLKYSECANVAVRFGGPSPMRICCGDDQLVVTTSSFRAFFLGLPPDAGKEKDKKAP